MSNFTFLSTTLPGAYADCARAESYVTSDPRAACVYARRAVELLVNHLYAPSAKRWTLRCPTRHQEPTPFASAPRRPPTCGTTRITWPSSGCVATSN